MVFPNFNFRKARAQTDLLGANSPREILLARRTSALEEIEKHQGAVKVYRGHVEREQADIDFKTKLVTDIDVALKVLS